MFLDSDLKKEPLELTTPSIEHIVDDTEIYIDPIAEGKALRKCDYVLIPLFTIAFMSAYLDRSNIGNAQTAGLLTDLNMSTQQYASTFSPSPPPNLSPKSKSKTNDRLLTGVNRCGPTILRLLRPIRTPRRPRRQEIPSQPPAFIHDVRVERDLSRHGIHEDRSAVLRREIADWVF